MRHWRHTYTVQRLGNHLRIMRRDGLPIRCAWDVLQKIKNDVLGTQTTAIEVYPAEGDLVDDINARHLFVVDNPPTFRGWANVEVTEL